MFEVALAERSERLVPLREKTPQSLKAYREIHRQMLKEELGIGPRLPLPVSRENRVEPPAKAAPVVLPPEKAPLPPPQEKTPALPAGN